MEIYTHGMSMPQLYQTTHLICLSPLKRTGGEANELYYMYLSKLVEPSSSLLITWLLPSLYAIFLGYFSLEFLTLFMCSLVQHSC